MCCAYYGLEFQKQFWGLLFSSSFEGWKHLSVKHTKSVACPDCFWVHQPWLYESATCPSNMTFLCNNQKDTFIWKQITSFILICIQWGAEKRNCSLAISSEIQNRNYVKHTGRVLRQPVAGSRFCGRSDATFHFHLIWTHGITNAASMFTV